MTLEEIYDELGAPYYLKYHNHYWVAVLFYGFGGKYLLQSHIEIKETKDDNAEHIELYIEEFANNGRQSKIQTLKENLGKHTKIGLTPNVFLQGKEGSYSKLIIPKSLLLDPTFLDTHFKPALNELAQTESDFFNYYRDEDDLRDFLVTAIQSRDPVQVQNFCRKFSQQAKLLINHKNSVLIDAALAGNLAIVRMLDEHANYLEGYNAATEAYAAIMRQFPTNKNEEKRKCWIQILGYFAAQGVKAENVIAIVNQQVAADQQAALVKLEVKGEPANAANTNVKIMQALKGMPIEGAGNIEDECAGLKLAAWGAPGCEGVSAPLVGVKLDGINLTTESWALPEDHPWRSTTITTMGQYAFDYFAKDGMPTEFKPKNTGCCSFQRQKTIKNNLRANYWMVTGAIPTVNPEGLLDSAQYTTVIKDDETTSFHDSVQSECCSLKGEVTQGPGLITFTTSTQPVMGKYLCSIHYWRFDSSYPEIHDRYENDDKKPINYRATLLSPSEEEVMQRHNSKDPAQLTNGIVKLVFYGTVFTEKEIPYRPAPGRGLISREKGMIKHPLIEVPPDAKLEAGDENPITYQTKPFKRMNLSHAQQFFITALPISVPAELVAADPQELAKGYAAVLGPKAKRMQKRIAWLNEKSVLAKDSPVICAHRTPAAAAACAKAEETRSLLGGGKGKQYTHAM